MLTKEECEKALDYMCYKCKEAHYDCDISCNRYKIFNQLINEHFELKEKYITLECDYSDLNEILKLRSGLSKNKIDKLEKALDKACEFIGCNFDCPYATLNQCTLDDRCSDDYKECWKEWLLDEVKE